MNKKIVLVELPLSTDLLYTFARKLEPEEAEGRSNVFAHYKISLAIASVSPEPPSNLVRAYVANELKMPIEDILIEPLKPIDRNYIPAPEVLQDLPKIRKKLLKKHIKSTIHQYLESPPLKARIWNTLVRPINKLIELYNTNAVRRINRIFNPPHVTPFDNPTYYIRTLPFIHTNFIRHCNPVSFLSVAFEEKDKAKAIELFQNDLKILSDKNLIQGHLAMPFIMETNDLIGTQQKNYILACFLFVDLPKIVKLYNINIYEDVCKQKRRFYLNEFLGLQTEASEGGVSKTGLNPENNYTVKQIEVFPMNRENIHNAYIDSFLNKKFVKVATTTYEKK